MTFDRNHFWPGARNLWLALALSLGLAGFASAQPPSIPPPTNPSARTAVQQPAEPYSLPPAKLAQAKALGIIRPVIYFGAVFWEILILWLLLATGRATRLADWITFRTIFRISRKWLQALLFSSVLIALLFISVDLPFGAVSHAFSLHYGISIQAWPSWLIDQCKTLGLALVFETPLLVLVLYLMQWKWSRRNYWFWFACTVAPLLLLVTFLLPPIIEPMFFEFEPLAKSHPELVHQLERVVARTGTSIPPDRMFLMKASEKSNGLNAYVTGLGASKRIVVWDTTADRMPADDILFTFAHETGHYVLHHIAKGLTLAAIGTFAFFWAISKFSEWMLRQFGKRWQVDTLASLPGLVILLLAFALLQFATEPIESGTSRYIEHEADVYGQEAIHGLVANPQKTAVDSFNKLGEAYLDDPDPYPFVVFWTYDHPSTQSRARFAEQYDPWAPGSTPRFFPK